MSLPPASSPLSEDPRDYQVEERDVLYQPLEKRPSGASTPSERRRSLLLSLLFHASLILGMLLWFTYERPEPERFIVIDVGGGTPTELLSDNPSDSVAEVESPQQSDATALETNQDIASNQVDTNPSQLAQPIPQPAVDVAQLEVTDSQQESPEQVTESSQDVAAATPETAQAEANPSEASDAEAVENTLDAANNATNDSAEASLEPVLSETETSQISSSTANQADADNNAEASSSQSEPANDSTPDAVTDNTTEDATEDAANQAASAENSDNSEADVANNDASDATESSQALPVLEAQTSIETSDSLPAPDSIAQSIPSPEIRSEVAATQAIPEPETRADVVESQSDDTNQAETETDENSATVENPDTVDASAENSVPSDDVDNTEEAVTEASDVSDDTAEDATSQASDNQEVVTEVETDGQTDTSQDAAEENTDTVAETSDTINDDSISESDTLEDNQELRETESSSEDVSGEEVTTEQLASGIPTPDTRSYVQPARAIPSAQPQAVLEAGRAIPSPAAQASVSAARSIPSPQARSELRISSSAPSIEAVISPAEGEAGQAGVGPPANQSGAPARAFEGIIRRPVAVMLDNTNNGYPQTGLQQANLIIEAPVTTDITRLMAVYKQDDAGQVGPIRSTREFFVRLTRNDNAILVHAGGSVEALSSIAENEQRTLDSLSRADIFARVPRGAVPYEYTLYSNGAAIREVLRNENLEQTQRVSISGYLPPNESPSNESVRVSMYNYSSGFQYNADNNQYRWIRRGSPASDSSGAVWVDAVVVANLAGASVLDGGTKFERLSVRSNSGSATLYLNGRTVSGTWRAAGGFTFLDSQGDALDLTPLKTWVLFVPPWGEVND